MDENEIYESGIHGKAEALFGGKICISIVKFVKSSGEKHGISLSKFYLVAAML